MLKAVKSPSDVGVLSGPQLKALGVFCCVGLVWRKKALCKINDVREKLRRCS
mgnify:CR=1 FL=1